MLARRCRETGGAGATPPLFVRGVPTSRTPPKVPVTGKLRLAFIHDPRRTPTHLRAALDKLDGVEVVPMYEPPRRALQRAVAEEFELVHLVTDGTVTTGYEGVLHFSLSEHKPSALDFAAPSAHRVYRLLLEGALRLQRVLPNPAIYWLSDRLYGKLDFETFSPRELSSMWRGSRVVAVSLSAPSTAERSPERFDGFLLPNVYRAFVAFGGTTLPMPNLIAPIGAMTDEAAQNFWHDFYSLLASSDCFSVEMAVEKARERAGAVPVALFLRQRLGHDFARPAEGSAPPHGKLRQVYSELVAAEDLLAQLKALDAKYEEVVDEKLSEATYSRERARQQDVKSELEEWSRATGEGEGEAAT